MIENMATYEDALEAKPHALHELRANYPEVSGVGIAPLEAGWALKVNLRRPAEHDLPQEVDGVPVITEVTGRVVASGSAGSSRGPL
jgi:hypothetical protein